MSKEKLSQVNQKPTRTNLIIKPPIVLTAPATTQPMTVELDAKNILRQNILKQNPCIEEVQECQSERKSPSEHAAVDLASDSQSQQRSQAIVGPISHDIIITTIIQLSEEINAISRRMEDLENRLAAAEESNPEIRKKKPRRKAQEIDKNFKCPYENCSKCYGSEVSLNLHIKLKHNGGTKTQRQNYMVRAEIATQKLKLSGAPVNDPKFSLPPQFLKSIEEQYQLLNRKLNRS